MEDAVAADDSPPLWGAGGMYRVASPGTACSRLESTLARLARDEPALRGMFVRVHAERARAEAAAADARAALGISLGPLDGALVSVKDLFDVAGEPTAAGSVVRSGAPPAALDSPVVRRLRAAGAVVVGRTGMTEFAFSGLGLNPHYGTPGNARNPAHIPGGSSSGAGVSVGLGLVDVAIGSDTGGSVRIPAAFNGVVGFKPGQHCVTREGAFPLSTTLDCIGPLAGSVLAAAAAHAVLADDPAAGAAALMAAQVGAGRPLPEPDPRHDGTDPALTAVRPPPWAAGVRGMRLGIPRGLLFHGADEGVLDGFGAVVAALESGGALTQDLDWDAWMATPFRVQQGGTIVAMEAYRIHRAALTMSAEQFDPRVRVRIENGRKPSGYELDALLQTRTALLAALDQQMLALDGLILPTVVIQAPLLSELQNDDAAYGRANLLCLRNTSVFNFYDLPAISLPVPPGLARVASLPVGLMLVGRRGDEAGVLRRAAAMEVFLRAASRSPG